MRSPAAPNSDADGGGSRGVAVRAPRTGFEAAAALAIGAAAFGAVAIGALAIGRLAIGRARVRVLRIDELRIGRLIRDDRD